MVSIYALSYYSCRKLKPRYEYDPKSTRPSIPQCKALHKRDQQFIHLNGGVEWMAASNPHFNAVSRDYDRGRVSEDILFWAREAERISGVNPGSLVVDMGCGTGNYGLGIRAQTGAVVVGFDPSEGMLRQAYGKTPDFPMVRAAAENIPLRGRLFDLSYAAQVWHHVRGRRDAAIELYRIARNGGCHIAHTIGHSQIMGKVVFRFFPEIMAGQLVAYPSDEEFEEIFRWAGFATVEKHPYTMERYQTTDEFIEIAEKRLWSMFRPITKAGLEKGVAELREWKRTHEGEPIRNDEMITLFVARRVD
jgi:ubiquinone/menaquinone biosynthesis C-methylase UbiE